MKFKIYEKDGKYGITVQKFRAWIDLTRIGSVYALFDTPEQARAAILDNVKSAEEVSE